MSHKITIIKKNITNYAPINEALKDKVFMHNEANLIVSLALMQEGKFKAIEERVITDYLSSLWNLRNLHIMILGFIIVI